MSDDHREGREGFRGALFVVPAPDSAYERLGREIEELAARITSRTSSTLQDDLSRLRVERCRMWMRNHGLGPR